MLHISFVVEFITYNLLYLLKSAFQTSEGRKNECVNSQYGLLLISDHGFNCGFFLWLHNFAYVEMINPLDLKA